MPILIKGSGGATAASLGYTEKYNEEDTGHVIYSRDDKRIYIRPREAAEKYGLSSIAGIANLCLRMRESGDLSHEIMISFGLGSSIGCRYLYVQWEGADSPEDAKDIFVVSGGCTATYDKTIGELAVAGGPYFNNFHDSKFDLAANVTWEIN